MKKIWRFLLAVLFAACLTACGSDSSPASDAGNTPDTENNIQEATDDAQMSESDSLSENSSESVPDEESEEKATMDQNTFYVSTGGKTFSAAFADTSGAQALKDLLASGDITIQMNDYGGFEKVGSLGQSLPAGNSQTTARAGDIVLYQGNQIVIFYGSNSWSYTRLGRINDLTGWQEALGTGDIPVTFSLQGE